MDWRAARRLLRTGCRSACRTERSCCYVPGLGLGLGLSIITFIVINRHQPSSPAIRCQQLSSSGFRRNWMSKCLPNREELLLRTWVRVRVRVRVGVRVEVRVRVRVGVRVVIKFRVRACRTKDELLLRICAINRHQPSSGGTRWHQPSSTGIRWHQPSSAVVNRHQPSSGANRR